MPGAGKGLGEDVINGSAARPAVTAKEGRTRERVREEGKERVSEVLSREPWSPEREGCQ